MTASLLKRIVEKTQGMGAAEQRVAGVVSTHPERVMHMSMAELSSEAQTSDPTIMRFSRRLGFDSFQQFKLALAQTLVPSAPFDYQQITAADSIETVVRKTCQNSLNAIMRAQDDLDAHQIGAAGRALSKAAWTGIYATGISEITCQDAEHKFQRLGLRCAAVTGRQKQALLAGKARYGEVALIFSQSGATRQAVEIAEASKAGDARVIAVTAAESPLAEQADILIAVPPYEQTELMTPLASRLNHALVVNMLVTAIAISMGSDFPDQLPALDSWRTDKL